MQQLFVQGQLRVQRGRWPWWQSEAVAEHHQVRKQRPARCWLLESDTVTQQVTHVQQRQLRWLGRLERLVGKLRSFELQRGLHQPQQKPRPDGLAV